MSGPVRCLDSRTGLLALLTLGFGCPSEPEPVPAEPADLFTAEGWARVTDESVDLFADMRPDDAVCDDAGWFVDPFRRTFEVETDLCNYITAGQDTLVAIAPGDTVTVYGIHDVLTADAPAQGYLGLALDGQLVWELSVDIPADAADFEETFTLDHAVPVGTEAQFHVHNHGPNTWELVAVTVTPAS